MPTQILIDGVWYTLTPNCKTDSQVANCWNTTSVTKPADIFDRIRPFQRLKQRAIDGAVARGANREEVEAALAEIGDRPILDWLMNGGLEKIIELILKILALL